MKIKLEKYENQLIKWPKDGYHIMAQFDEHKIIVYQSYRPEIGLFAAKYQYFGGAFSLNRMTWIKPNFLWMMYRNGWGEKSGQEVVLAIHLKIEAFVNYLEQVVFSTYQPELHSTREEWQLAVQKSDARLQWDPDHDPYGNKLKRRAIQIGLRNKLISSYSREDIIEIEDISGFVAEQRKIVQSGDLSNLVTPEEQPLLFDDIHLNNKLKLNNSEISIH